MTGKIFRGKILLYICGAITFLFTACNLLDEELLRQLKDNESPEITITSPLSFSSYGSVISLEGHVRDDSGIITGLSYSIEGTAISGVLTPDVDGTFSRIITARTSEGVQIVDGNRIIAVTATDPSGNSSTVSVEVRRIVGAGDISGFTALPLNKAVRLSWDEIPGATGYSVRMLQYDRSIIVTDNSVVWENLDNGNLYSFIVTAQIPDEIGSDAVSETLSAVPLSIRTLAPRVSRLAFGEALIDWDQINASGSYVVERRIDEGSWSVYRITSSHELYDNSLIPGHVYEYRISPYGIESVASDSIVLRAPLFPPGESALLSSVMIQKEFQLSTVLKDNYAYTAEGDSGIRITDLRDPTRPLHAGYWDIGRTVLSIDSCGDLVSIVSMETEDYLAIMNNSFGETIDDVLTVLRTDLVSLENPGSPVFKGSLMNSGFHPFIPVPVVSAADDDFAAFAYFKDYDAGLGQAYSGLDLYSRGPGGTLDFLASVNLGSDAASLIAGLAISDGYLYVYHNELAMRVYDLNADPSSPPVITSLLYSGSLPDDGMPLSMSADGDLLLITTLNGNARLLDISSPSSPVVLDLFSRPAEASGWAMDGFIRGEKLYIAYTNGFYQTVDASDPGNLISLGTVTLAHDSSTLSFDRDSVIISGEGGFSMLAVSSGRNFMSESVLSGIAVDYAVRGNQLYTSLSYPDTGVDIHDISNPGFPVKTGHLETPENDYIRQLYASGNFLFGLGTSGSDAVLAVFDITPDSQPGLISRTVFSETLYNLDVSGSHIYIGSSSGILIYEISDLSDPRYIYTLNRNSMVRILLVQDNILYADNGFQDLYAFDVSSPSLPVLLGVYTYPESKAINRLYFDYDRLYVIRGDDNLSGHLVQYEPASLSGGVARPAPLNDLTLDIAPDALYVQGDLAVLTTHTWISGLTYGTVRLYDISDRDAPVLMDSTGSYPGWLSSVTMVKDQLYVMGSAGFRIFSLSE
ncbi:MAG: hypothetical protein JXR86_07375 [Spirochaetales bacterium]|nr:hypothetical protein [Spirochaetales bacterium]